MHFLPALSTPSHLGVQNMLQELLTLTRGQVVEEILWRHLDEPAQTWGKKRPSHCHESSLVFGC